MQRSQPLDRFRQIIFLVASLLILSLTLMVLDDREVLDPVKSLFGTVISPVGETLSDFDFSIGGNPPPESELERQLNEIVEERDALLAENTRLREEVADINELREQLDFQQQHPELETLTANVTSRDPQSVEKFIIIDRGTEDGVEVGMAVVSPNYLVGQVIEADPNRAKVLLVIDAGFQTGARLQTSRGAGIVYGLWQAGGRAEMRHIPLDTEVASDELVITSGRSLLIPEGLIIGRVMETQRDELGNEITVQVLPLVDFDDLETVSVIVGPRE